MNVKQILIETAKETKGLGLILKLNAVCINMMMRNKNFHNNLLAYLNNKNNVIYKFYIAKIFIYYGKFKEALDNIDEVLSKFSNAEIIYLKAFILYNICKKKEAVELLKQMLSDYKEKKIWILICSYHDEDLQYNDLINTFNYINGKVYKYNDYVVLHYLIHALIIKNKLDIANWYISKLENNLQKNKKTKKDCGILKRDAKKALFDLQDILDKEKILFFLISGTFLGCVRNKDFIDYDYDLDVGVFVDLNLVRNAVFKIGCFKVLNFSKYILKLRHLNGVDIDIFFHYKNDGFIIHKSRYDTWVNSIFELEEYLFLNRKFLGPKDYKTYLNENYGNWKESNKNFSNLLDTPNLLVENKEIYLILLKMLLNKPYGIKNRNKIISKINEIEGNKDD